MADWIGHIVRSNYLLKHVIEAKIEGRIEWWEDEEEDVSSYRVTLMKWEDTGNWKRKHRTALCGELALEEAMDLL